MSIGSSPLRVDNFSGGITDNYISAPPNKYQKADNLLIVPHKALGKLISRPGSEIFDATNPRPTTTRTGDLRFFKSVLYSQNVRNMYYYSSGWNEIVGPVTSNKPFNSSFTSANRISVTDWNNHLFIATDNHDYINKIYENGSNTPTLRTAGLPELASTPTVTGTGVGRTFVYRFIYSYAYSVRTVSFKDFGPYVQTGIIANNNDPATTNIAISAIPVLANGAVTNWETTAIKCEIYRTINGGTVFYKVGEVTNGTTVFTDNVSDTNLQLNSLLYTEGGVAENSLPPFAKFMTITGDNGIAWYANIKVGSEIKTTLIQQSKPGDPDACPGSFNGTVAEDIQGISSVRGFPIVICDGSAYRIEGYFDITGGGGFQPIKISDSTSCVNAASIVQTLEGIYWWGRDGIYYSDGYKVIKINVEWPTTYSGLVDSSTKRSFIYGAYDKTNNRIIWSCAESDGATDSDKAYVLHLDWGVSDDMPFTSMSGGAAFAPSAICFDADAFMYRGDSRGYVLKHEDEIFSDPKIDTTVAVADWEKQVITYDYKSAAFDFGQTQVRKYVTKIILTCKNKTNLSTQITSINDDGRKISNLSPIRFRGNLVWGDPVPEWSDDSILWNFDGLIEPQRFFPAQGLRCEYKQVQFTNAYVPIVNSDALGLFSVNATAKTATLVDTATVDLPDDLVDYYVSFATDDYVRQYLITAKSGDMITFQDTQNLVVGGNLAWVIRGYPKDEIINILSYNIDFTPISQTQDAYKSSGSGEVGSGS